MREPLFVLLHFPGLLIEDVQTVHLQCATQSYKGFIGADQRPAAVFNFAKSGVEASSSCAVRAGELVTFRDVVQRRRSRRVQPEIQPAKSQLARRNEMVVQQANDAGERRRRVARAIDGEKLADEKDSILCLEGGDVGVPASGYVTEAP